MLIYFGKKRQEKAMGFVVDFCPICRELSEFLVSKINDPRLSYGIPLATGATVGYLRECTQCKTFMHADPIRYAAFASRRRRSSIKSMAEATFPRAFKYHAKRLQLEKLIRQSPHTVEEKLRVELVAETFETLAPMVERSLAHNYLDSRLIALTLFGLSIIFGLLPFIATQSSLLEENKLPLFVFTVFSFGLILGWQWKTRQQRFMRDEIYPRIAKALKVLTPTEEEFSIAVNIAKRNGKQIGELTCVSDLLTRFD